MKIELKRKDLVTHGHKGVSTVGVVTATFLVSATVMFGALVACGSSSATDSTSSLDGGIDATPGGGDSSSPSIDAGAVDSGADDGGVPMDSGTSSLETINGTALDSDSNLAPLPNVTVTLIDATGATRTAVSGANGGFTFSGISLPYDLMIAPVTKSLGPTIYHGLTELSPQAMGNGTPPYLRGGTVRNSTVHVSFSGPDCGTSTCTYTAFVKSSDPNPGYGTTGASYTAATANSAFDVPYTWTGAAAATATLAVFVTDANTQRFWYYAETISVADGQTTSAGQVAPTMVGVAGMMTASIVEHAIPNTWAAPNTILALELPGGGDITLQTAYTTVLSSAVPNVPGATILVLSTVTDPNNKSRSAQADVSHNPLSTSSLAVDLTMPPQFETPVDGAHIKVGDTISWTLFGSAAPAIFDIYDSTNSATLATVYTMSPTIALADLMKFGISIEPGPYELDIGDTRPFANVDAFVANVPRVLESGATSINVTVDP